MPNLLVAGNSTNGGTAISTDTSGTLNIVTGSGSGSNAITIDASQAVTMPGTLAVTGAQTIGGNLTVTGTLSATGGLSGGIRSGTAVTVSGTSIDFTSLPTGIKRITVMFSGVSTNGSSVPLIQLGDSGGVETTGYASAGGRPSAVFTSTAGLLAAYDNNPSWTLSGIVHIDLINTNSWVSSGTSYSETGALVHYVAGRKSLSDTLDRVRITTVNGTDTFDAGTVNIFYE